MSRVQLVVTITCLCFSIFLSNCGSEEKTSSNVDSKGKSSEKNEVDLVFSRKLEDSTLIVDISESIKDLTLRYKNSIIYERSDEFVGKLTIPMNTDFLGIGVHRLNLNYTQGNEKVNKNLTLKILANLPPVQKKAIIVNRFPHQNTSYTQGLEFHDNKLYEGTGQYGESFIAQVDLNSGSHLMKKEASSSDFGEGITILNNKIYQLTWQNKKCYVYDLKTFRKIKEFVYNTEGWGLTNDGTNLIMSDGSQNIYFRDPKTFEVLRSIQIATNSQEIPLINELEFIKGKLFANIYQWNVIVEIDPMVGSVLGIIDCSDLVKEIQQSSSNRNRPDVLNGIAYNESNNKFYVTGKYWETLFEIKF